MRKICLFFSDHLFAFFPEPPPDFRAFFVGDELPLLLSVEACRF
jgi:hypothetical protein